MNTLMKDHFNFVWAKGIRRPNEKAWTLFRKIRFKVALNLRLSSTPAYSALSSAWNDWRAGKRLVFQGKDLVGKPGYWTANPSPGAGVEDEGRTSVFRNPEACGLVPCNRAD
ncbi:hypothetical protein FB45DRAFT_1037691 [Roridomyces roridus]|uniref:Uncharacterized protein n=1 Tax=Roridomyces roridus TaxID=1738132 RepID=A0AAD7F9L2_9AGAR|nr:hypothetical protein FB45DRAFT_1037691 [Roridomyces roridus]